MPKQVDHERRRREIADVVRRVLVSEGVEATSVRAVAAASGWSAGAVRHYFPDHDALLLFAVEEVMADVPRRLRDRLAATPSTDSALLLLEEVLPLDDVRRFETQVWWATIDRARRDRAFDAVRTRMWEGLRHVCEVAATWAGDATDAPRLHALLDGLAVQCFCYPETMTPGVARTLLAAHLRSLPPPRPGVRSS